MDRRFLLLSDDRKLEEIERTFDDYAQHSLASVKQGKLIPNIKDLATMAEYLAELTAIVRKNLGSS